MKISFEARAANADALVVMATEGGKLLPAAAAADKKSKGAIKRALVAEKFQAKKAQTLVIAGPAGFSCRHIVVLGLGKGDDLSLHDFEKMGSQLTSLLNARKAASAQVVFDGKGLNLKGLTQEKAAAQLAAGALLNSYRFDKYLTKEPKDKKPTLKTVRIVLDEAVKARKLFETHQKAAESVFLVRDLVTEAPNVLYPESFANIIRKELAPLGIKVNVLSMKDMQKLGMGALIAVGQGSVREPKLVTMSYEGGKKGQAPVAFVGKGVTFDTGGISLKPGPGMEEMKFDMAGAAVVTGLLKTLASRKAAVNAVGVVALAENMPSGNATRPGDIVTSMSGQTIDIHNTDAEGRLILCDALWYVQETFKPKQIVDLATLTGAVIIALGHEYGGLFANDDTLANHLTHAGKEVGEELWRMPLNDAWDKAIDTPAADMKNISGGRDAGSAIGAHFLKRFIKPGVKWAHLDIAGVAWAYKDRVSVPKGASAFGVRLLDQFVADYCEG